MSVHRAKMLLLDELDKRQIAKAVEIISLGDLEALDAMIKLHNRIAPNDFSMLLRIMDCKGLYGIKILEALTLCDFEPDKFIEFVFEKMPCQICHKLENWEAIINRLNKQSEATIFFGNLYSVSIPVKYDADWQLASYGKSLEHRGASIINPLPGYDIGLFGEIVNEMSPIELEEEIEGQIDEKTTIVSTPQELIMAMAGRIIVSGGE
jgi:hypothetical protein